MRFNQVIELVSVDFLVDELGNQREVKTSRQIYANEWGISSSEFYSAATQGLKPEKRFEIHSFEYGGESKLSHEGVEYRIIRSEKIGEKIRISCEKVIGNG
jgi:hypothetical protein